MLENHCFVSVVETILSGTAVGKRIAEIGARMNKKISLEMGGKNAAIVYPSCDLAKHIPTIAR